VNPVFVEEASQRLSGSDCKVVVVIGFPLGANLIATKVEETRQVIDLGAQEIDMVLPVGLLKAAEYEAVFRHLEAVVVAAKPLPVKVILETALLSQSEKVAACVLSDWAGAAFVKTSTGFSSKGATSEDVKLMRSVISDRMGVKAAGGIGSLEKALEMLEAGADRLGASGSAGIMEEALAKEALRA
jgi:deoxyribose-phosphate aldolase